VPSEMQTFKWHARRPDVGVWKEIPQDAASMVQWRERIRLFFEYTNPDGSIMVVPPQWKLSVLSEAEIRDLREKYEFQYVLCTHYPALPYPELYRNGRFVVYRLP